MNAIPEMLTSSNAPDVCHQVLNQLFSRWPEEPSDSLSSALLDHFCHCRSCLQKWIALEAAAELAFLPSFSGNEPLIDAAVTHQAQPSKSIKS